MAGSYRYSITMIEHVNNSNAIIPFHTKSAFQYRYVKL